MNIPTTYTGNLSFWSRPHTASDYLLYIEDEATKQYSSFAIDQADTTYENSVLTIACSLSLIEGRMYNCFIFPQNGSLTDSTGTTKSWWDGFLTLANAGTIQTDVVRFNLFATDQSDVQKYSIQNGRFTAYSTPTTDKVISYGG